MTISKWIVCGHKAQTYGEKMKTINFTGFWPGFDKEHNLFTDILREQLGFEGFVVSDWGAVAQLQHMGLAQSKKECAQIALNAGVDLDMCD